MKNNNHCRTAMLLPSVLVLFSTLFASCITQGLDNHMGDLISKRVIIQSSVLQEERPILVHLPREYDVSGSQYPVLYILDADQGDHFQKSVELVESLAEGGEIPGMIIIGIENTSRLRDMNVPVFNYQGASIVGGADKFLKFIESELITFIDENYRTSPSRILFGRSASATFSIFAMVSHPLVFDAYIASSPSFFVNEESITVNTQKFFENKKSLDRIFFMNLGTEDSTKRVKQTKQYAALIEQLAPSEFKWELRIMNGSGHVPKTSLEDGLGMVYGHISE